MVAGELYNASDPELVAARRKARRLCRAFNATRPDELEERGRVTRELFAEGGQTVRIEPPFFCDYGFNIRLGESVYLQLQLHRARRLRSADRQFHHVRTCRADLYGLHPMNAELRRSVEYGKPVQIGSDVWVGGGAIICPGVRIGSRTVIGAGSVVTRDLPEGVFAAGNPCRVIREINENHRTDDVAPASMSRHETDAMPLAGCNPEPVALC